MIESFTNLMIIFMIYCVCSATRSSASPRRCIRSARRRWTNSRWSIVRSGCGRTPPRRLPLQLLPQRRFARHTGVDRQQDTRYVYFFV